MGVFTRHTSQDGSFGVGQIPDDLKAITKELGTTFYEHVPSDKKNNMTYHIWYDQFPTHIKELVNQVQNHPFWRTMCSGNKCVMRNVREMDELYYSKAPPKHTKGIMYGASTNYDTHVDASFRFPGIRFYRVLIGLTDGNQDVETQFVRLGESKFIQKNDYIVFDFDRALHRVVNHGANPDQYRILLKLHFCVCDECAVESTYFNTICKVYSLYENVTRYIMQTGTEPKTYHQFFWGLLCYIFNVLPSICILYVLLFPVYFITRIPLIGELIIYITCVYLVLVAIFWLRYKLFQIR